MLTLMISVNILLIIYQNKNRQFIKENKLLTSKTLYYKINLEQ